MADSDSTETRSPKRHHRFIDLAGLRFGNLVVIGVHGVPKAPYKWSVQCDCGSTKVVLGSNLREHRTKSCGCLKRETASLVNKKHGLRSSCEFKSWASMIQRCANPKDKSFNRYGGRGIVVCAEWNSFEAFYADMGPRPSVQHSLDRIDVNENYEPKNCRWATRSQQARNTRLTLYITFNGKRLPMADVADLIGVTYSTLENRMRRGETGDRLFRQTRTRVGRLTPILPSTP